MLWLYCDLSISNRWHAGVGTDSQQGQLSLWSFTAGWYLPFVQFPNQKQYMVITHPVFLFNYRKTITDTTLIDMILDSIACISPWMLCNIMISEWLAFMIYAGCNHITVIPSWSSLRIFSASSWSTVFWVLRTATYISKSVRHDFSASKTWFSSFTCQATQKKQI